MVCEFCHRQPVKLNLYLMKPFPILLALLFYFDLGGSVQAESKAYVQFDGGFASQENLKVEISGATYDLETRDGLRFDFHCGYRIKKWAAVEVEAGVIETKLNDLAEHDLYQIPMLVNLVLNYPGEKFWPFFNMGIGGLEWVAVPKSWSYRVPTDSDFVFAGQVSAGLRYRIQKHLELELGYKLLLVSPVHFQTARIDSSRTHSFFVAATWNF